MPIKSLHIQNFKSIKDSGIVELKPINILIGGNGVGKSNFISFLRFLSKLSTEELQMYMAQNGRAESFLYFGRKTSDFLGGNITFDNEYQNGYQFKLVPDSEGNLIFSEEFSHYTRPTLNSTSLSYRSGNRESHLNKHDGYRNKYLRSQLKTLKIFHFHDTSFNSKMKQPCDFNDYEFLYEDGGNIAAFLYMLQKSEPNCFAMIERVIRSIAPFFDSFFLEPDKLSPNLIYLRWKEKGYDQLFNAHNLSDGTLRMICLTTLLLQPNPPKTIIIDEPELGLHPFAIRKLASLIQTVKEGTQIIISTQSVNLVNEFSPEDVLVVQRLENHETSFIRHSKNELERWLKDYSLGELWEKNILGGRPR